MSVIKYDSLDGFIVRYVRNFSTQIQKTTDIKNLKDAKSYIVRETLKYLYDTAREYERFHELVRKESFKN